MAPKQRMRVANEKASKYITMRGNVPKSAVSGKINVIKCHLSENALSDQRSNSLNFVHIVFYKSVEVNASSACVSVFRVVMASTLYRNNILRVMEVDVCMREQVNERERDRAKRATIYIFC